MTTKGGEAKSSFKIRDKLTGLYSNGGSDAATYSYYGWGKKGKVWQGIGPLRLHLNHVISNGAGDTSGIMDRWEIIELEMVEKSNKTVLDWIKPEKLVELLSKVRK